MMGLGLGMGLFGLIWMLLFWGALIALAVWLIRLLFPATQDKSDNHGAETLAASEILKTRYAQGELTAEQYQEMVQTIRQ